MNYILFDDNRDNFLPLTFTRPVCEIRFGILTIREKWEKYLGARISYLTEDYLGKKFPLAVTKQNILINGSVCPNKNLLKEILSLNSEEALMSGNMLIAAKLPHTDISNYKKKRETKTFFASIRNLWDIFQKNGKAIEDDFYLLTAGRKSKPISKSNHIILPTPAGKGKNGTHIFVEPGAKIECSVLNASAGPIYISKNAEVMEACAIRGPFSLGENSQLKIGTKIYGPTTIGPESKAGGEINNSVIFGFSNKAHDGFMGNSVIGEWCNIGAGSNNSNLKNNYMPVKLWTYSEERFATTGLTFCGLTMGDHSKCGINTMFNTGTVVGVSVNIFGSSFTRTFVPDFAWGGVSTFVTYRLHDALATAEKVLARRNKKLSDADKKILTEVFTMTEKYRKA